MAMHPELPSEYVSLAQNIQLNETGWRDRSDQRLVAAALWSAGGCVMQKQIEYELRKMLGVDLGSQRLEKSLEQLCVDNVVVRLPTGEYQITTEMLDQFARDAESVRSDRFSQR